MNTRASTSPHPPALVHMLGFCIALFLATGYQATLAVDADRAASSVILTPIQAENLGIESVEVDFSSFQTTVFAVGQLEEQPSARSVLSSRIAGRAIEVNAFLGDTVSQGDVLVVVESLQPGDPPPSIPLKAATSGIVVESNVRLGQPVDPSSELLHIADHSTLWAVASVPEHAGATLSAGSAARILIPSASNDILSARLARFGTQADHGTGTTRAIFEIPNPEGNLVPGMRVEFSLITAERENVMAVPLACIQGTESAPLVYVRDFELPNVFVRAPVVLGERNATVVEIVKGLFPGDEVITTGSYGLNHVGGSSGMSLKEVLDAAHGHEHNEDGSEMTAEQQAAPETEAQPHGTHELKAAPRWLVYYAAGATLALLLSFQLLWSKTRNRGPDPATK